MKWKNGTKSVNPNLGKIEGVECVSELSIEPTDNSVNLLMIIGVGVLLLLLNLLPVIGYIIWKKFY